jgi:hypothetical protein
MLVVALEIIYNNCLYLSLLLQVFDDLSCHQNGVLFHNLERRHQHQSTVTTILGVLTALKSGDSGFVLLSTGTFPFVFVNVRRDWPLA